ncbi:BEL1-like homeodomain protein 1 [Impatiens glandulifera]|uniref:BEL1-like homeodomain protein 1 n=1 Tax=Impatiens glandulifera TaxID=253017 RepID=UPI001FB0C953|nr:BEL1-like homeodomain protein 1 [Impatiens glandulifera]XP_047310387.1 BEL1-like homeodomain protein 1 [Impatiens glandulifera]
MATYFHGNPSEIQADGLQTLILMNPGYNVGYSSTTTHHPQPPSSSSSNFALLSSRSFDAPPTTNAHQFVGIPLPLTSSVDPHPFHGLIPRPQYHFYGQFDQALPAREINRSQQGLSLTLSSQEMGGGSTSRAAVLSPTSGGGSPSSASGISNNGGIVGTGVQSVLLGSKYLKATQELLEETVTVGKGKNGNATVKATRESFPGGGSGGGEGEISGGELTTVERQEIQMKKAKLVHMLDEVEQRYSQYHHQIQMVISWFEQVAGIGSARTYTALAVETISKQFRCLKDTILGQIKAASKSLGEEEDEEQGKNEGSRLKFVDHQFRQQKTLQQLGMIQPNAWRPQRGLPERSVSVLRAWLFEHFLHPYPKDSDKQMLAKQTGLTRSQVSNWFINARVRLWKPMVEEMYMEETKENEKTGSDEKKKDNDPTVTIPTSLLSNRNPSLFALIDSSDMELEIHGSPKKQRSNNNEMEMNAEQGEEVITNDQDQILMKFSNDQRQTRDVGFSLLGAAPTNFIGGFGTYFGSDQFPGSGYSTNNNNGVSLTLGLPHCENLNQSFLPNNNNPNNMGLGGRRVNLGEQQNEFAPASSSSSHRPVVYETVNLQNRKRFAA